jgi:uncharacterized phage protein (TIGR02220 family)
MRHKQVPTWFPLYIDKWLLGSTRHELTHEERAIWTDLMALSKKDQGYIRANEGIPYPLEQLAGMLMSRFDTFEKTLQLVQRVIEKCLSPGVKKLKRMADGTLFVLSHESYLLSDRWERELNKRKPIPNKRKSIPPKRKPSNILSSNIILSSIEEIIKYLNTKAGKAFRADSKETVAFIKARLAEGRTVEDFKKVIDIKVQKWAYDPKMADFLRPSTLFRPVNFEAYLNEGPAASPPGEWAKKMEAKLKAEKEAEEKS